jgi:hypothetical protein
VHRRIDARAAAGLSDGTRRRNEFTTNLHEGGRDRSRRWRRSRRHRERGGEPVVRPPWVRVPGRHRPGERRRLRRPRPEHRADSGWGIRKVRATVAYRTNDGERFVWTAFGLDGVELGRAQTRFTRQKSHDSDVLSFMLGRGLRKVRVRYVVTFVDDTNPSRTEVAKDVFVLLKASTSERRGTDRSPSSSRTVR